MTNTFMIRWNDTGVRGFRSRASAQQHIDKVCMIVAPDLDYKIEPEF